MDSRELTVDDDSGVVADRDLLGRAVARLPRGQRAAVVLRFIEDLSEAETARLLDVSIGTVKSQTSRALARLRLELPALLDTDAPRRTP